MNNMQNKAALPPGYTRRYLIGIVMYFAVLSPIIDAAPDQFLSKLGDYQNLMYTWIFIAYWVSAFCLVIVALALHERLKSGAPALIQIATALALIWASLIIGSGNMMMHGFIQVPKSMRTTLHRLKLSRWRSALWRTVSSAGMN
jgi:pilus assembly protein TadC